MKKIELVLVDFDLIKLKFPDDIYDDIENDLNLEGDYPQFMESPNFLKALSKLKKKFTSVKISNEFHYTAISKRTFIYLELPALIVRVLSPKDSVKFIFKALKFETSEKKYSTFEPEIYNDNLMDLFPKKFDVIHFNLPRFIHYQNMIYESLMNGGYFNEGWYQLFLELGHELS